MSTLSLPQEKLSTASQTDLSGELVPIGTRLAEMARTRLQYDEARKRVQLVQRKLADLEEKVTFFLCTPLKIWFHLLTNYKKTPVGNSWTS